MSEFGESDFKSWLAWATKTNKTVWEYICDRFTDPDKCWRAWSAYKEWLGPVVGIDFKEGA